MSTRRTLPRIARVGISTFAIFYLGSIVFLMFFERSMVYPAPARQANGFKHAFTYEDVWLDTGDGHRVHGWYLPHESSRASVLFFHGNGEDISSCGPEMANWRDALAIDILVMDYRGYGQSSGKPAEKMLIDDGILAANWLASRNEVSASELVLWGRSIGGGVAAGVAQNIKPRAMLLESTFDSLANVAAVHFPWLPVRLLMTNQYQSAIRLANYDGTFIQWHGDQDEIIPLALARHLYDSIKSENKAFFVGKRHGHNDDSPAEFKAAVREFFSARTR